MKIKLNKGRTALDIRFPDEKIIDILMGKNVPALAHEQIRDIIKRGIQKHSPRDISDKKIAVVIPDNTRLWARGDLYIPDIIKTLLRLGAAKKNIVIIIALGTHTAMELNELPQLAGAWCAQNIRIVNSANQDAHRLVHIGTTHKKTELYITREAAQADHIVIFGGVLHHMLAGFGGGRKYILPGVAGYDSIQQNHSLAVRKDGTPHPLVRQAKLWGNPVNEDVTDAARMFLADKTCSYAAVAANGTGQIFHADVGDLDQTFHTACRALDQACCVPVGKRGDFTVISTGGHLADTQLYQSTKALFNAVNIVKKGGRILFIAGCEQGIGNTTFEQTLANYKDTPEKAGQQLIEKFNMPVYVALRVMEILNRFTVTLFSDLPEKTVRRLGFNHTDSIESFVKRLPGKGYIIPFAENILPVMATP